MDLCTPFTAKEAEALQDVIDLAWTVISDDGGILPGHDDQVAALRIVEAMLPDRVPDTVDISVMEGESNETVVDTEEYEITLSLKLSDRVNSDPNKWDWNELIDIGPSESVEVTSCRQVRPD